MTRVVILLILFISKLQAVTAQSAGKVISSLDFNLEYILANSANFHSPGTPNFQYFLPLAQSTVLFHKNGFSWYSPKTKTQDSCQLTILFKHANPLVEVQAISAVKHYFTIGELPYKFKGYTGLIYKNIFPNIDWIIQIDPQVPESFKYTWRLKPGANPSHILYTSPNASIEVNENYLSYFQSSDSVRDGELMIYDQTGKKIDGKFIQHDAGVGISITSQYGLSDTLYIDPWVSKISTLTRARKKDKKQTENVGFDLDYDYKNNVYVYGGQTVLSIDTPMNFSGFKLAKYDPNGGLKWVFSGNIVAPGFKSSLLSESLSTLLVQKNTEKIYIGCDNFVDRSRIIRLDSNGLYDNCTLDTNYRLITANEMQFDPNNEGNIAVFGKNYSWFAGDTIELNIKAEGKNSIDLSVTGKKSPGNRSIQTAGQDYSGLSYAMVATGPADSIINTNLYALNANYKGNRFTTYTQLPVDANMYLWTRYRNANNNGIVFTGSANGIAANDNYVFCFDGKIISAIDKKTKNAAGNTFKLTNPITARATGLATDPCNHLFAAGDSGNIFCLSFNGTQFNLDSQLLIWGTKRKCVIQDIRFNPSNGLLFATGDSFVCTQKSPYSCRDTSLNIQKNPICGSVLYAILNNPDTLSTYTFEWFDSTSLSTVQETTKNYKFGDTFSKAKPFHQYSLRIYRNKRIGGYYRDYPFKVFPRFDTVITVTLCEGDSFVYLGNTYFSSISRNDTFQNRYGCDSAHQFNLIVLPRSIQRDTVMGCLGDTFTIFGKRRWASGIYVDSLKNQWGCDSITYISLILNSDTTIIQNFNICEGDSVFVAQQWRKTSGIGTEYFLRTTGCDSVVAWKIEVNKPSKTVINRHLCPRDSFVWNGNTYLDSGQFTYNYKTIKGCDSIITIHISQSNFSSNFQIDSTQKPRIQLKRFTSFNQSQGTWTWYGDDRARTSNSDTVHFNWKPDNKTHSMKLVDSDTWGCRDSMEYIFFSPINTVRFFNILTPNGDGLNDVLFFESTGTDFVYSFYIYNRWGELMYATENSSIRDISNYWNGNVNNGQIECPEGTYFGQFYTHFSTAIQPINSPNPQNRSFPKPISVVITLIR